MLVAVQQKKDDTEMSSKDINALDKFRATILEVVDTAANELVDNLENVYANMDIQLLLDMVDECIEDFTYDAMNAEDLYAEMED